MEHEGLRYNEGKVQLELLPVNALKGVGEVLTKGAKKYRPRNWEAGMCWSTVLASLKRHLFDFEQGFDVDPDDGLHLIDKVATNALFLAEYRHTYHQGDDRQKRTLLAPKIALDIDEVIADWVSAYCYKYELDIPKCWNFDRKIGERCEEIWKDKDFWMGIRPKTLPDDIPFEPVAYVTSRHIPTEWTEEWLDLWKFPIAPVISTAGKSKVEAVIESGATIFVDDNFETFRELNNAGICCYLFSAAHNLRYDVGDKRIENLKDLYWFKGMEINQTKINYEKKD